MGGFSLVIVADTCTAFLPFIPVTGVGRDSEAVAGRLFAAYNGLCSVSYGLAVRRVAGVWEVILRLGGARAVTFPLRGLPLRLSVFAFSGEVIRYVNGVFTCVGVLSPG